MRRTGSQGYFETSQRGERPSPPIQEFTGMRRKFTMMMRREIKETERDVMWRMRSGNRVRVKYRMRRREIKETERDVR